MVAWRYESSLLVLKKIFHSFPAFTREIFFNTRREISYLRAAMILYLTYLFVILMSCKKICMLPSRNIKVIYTKFFSS